MTTRVLIADDHAIVRDGLRRILATDPHFLVCGEAKDGHEVVAALRAGGFDVLLLDLTMPGRSGIELLRQVKAERPELRVLVLTMLDEQEFAVRAIRAGASGYLTKDTVSNQLIEALRKIAAGGLFITPAVAEALAQRLQEPEDDLPHRRLSEREYEVFLLLAAGESPSGIARRLHLSVKTVSTHKTNLLQKMRLGSLAELVRYAVAQGLLESSVAPNREAGRSG